MVASFNIFCPLLKNHLHFLSNSERNEKILNPQRRFGGRSAKEKVVQLVTLQQEMSLQNCVCCENNMYLQFANPQNTHIMVCSTYVVIYICLFFENLGRRICLIQKVDSYFVQQFEDMMNNLLSSQIQPLLSLAIDCKYVSGPAEHFQNN